MTKFTNFFTKLISIILGILIILNISSIIFNERMCVVPNNTFSKILTYSLITVGGILMVVGILALFKLINKLSDKGLTRLAIALIGIYSIVTIANIFLFPAVPNTDSYFVQDYVIKMVRGDVSVINGNNYYFAKYSNNNAFVLILYFLYKAFSFVGESNLLVVGRIFNCLCIIGGIVLFYFAIIKFTGKKATATKFLLLSVLFPSVQFSSSWVYTATICMPFIGGIFLCGANLIKATTKKSITINSAIIGVLSVVGYKVRPVVIFITLAGIICMFFWAFKDKKKLMKSLFSLIVCAVVAVTSFAICKAIDNHYYTGSNKQYPLTHWIAMSLQGDGSYIPSYNAKHQMMHSTEEINKDSIKDIERTLSSYTPITFFQHQYDKSSLMWGEGNLGYYTRQRGNNHYSDFHDYIYGSKSQMLLMYCQMLWLSFHLLILVSLYKLFRNKSSKKNLLLSITLLGAFVFYMLWEVKINYALPFVSIIIALATSGGVSIENKLTLPAINVKKCYRVAYITVASVFIALLLANTYFVAFDEVRRDSVKLENAGSVSTTIENVSMENKVLKQTFYTDSSFNTVTLLTTRLVGDIYSRYKVTLTNSENKVLSSKMFYNLYSFEHDDKIELKLPNSYTPSYNEKFTVTIEGKGTLNDFIEFNYSDSSQIDCIDGELTVNHKPINGDLKFYVWDNNKTTLMSCPAYIILVALVALLEYLTYRALFKTKRKI